jgi:hypothetical protein
VTLRAAVQDPLGRTVLLTDERWTHIATRHPEISGLEADVLEAVRAPDRTMPGREPNEAWNYLLTAAPSTWLKVVVAFVDGRGHIVTAFAGRTMP